MNGPGSGAPPGAGKGNREGLDNRSVERSAPLSRVGLGRRLACLVYDALLLLAVLLLGAALFTTVVGSADTLPERIALQLTLVLLSGAYFVWCWTRSGQTLPMQAWHLRIIDSASGRPPSIRKAVTRYVVAVLGTLLAGAAFLWALFDRDRQFLHDRVAGTRIASVKRVR